MGKHVIVEFPLSVDVAEARDLVVLAISQNRLLHVEHIELLGGMHQALKTHLPAVGDVFYVRYATINPQRPAPRKWTFHHDLFGFPLIGALSRIHRLTDVFGAVETVNCQTRFWDAPETGQSSAYYRSCLCTAHLRFKNGLVAEVTYGKGENLWQPERRLEVHGESGALLFDGDEGMLVLPEERRPIEVGARRGLFAKDTANVLDHLVLGTPLYVASAASLYALKVADAARRSAETGQTVVVE
jgi:biliverdin reductase